MFDKKSSDIIDAVQKHFGAIFVRRRFEQKFLQVFQLNEKNRIDQRRQTNRRKVVKNRLKKRIKEILPIRTFSTLYERRFDRFWSGFRRTLSFVNTQSSATVEEKTFVSSCLNIALSRVILIVNRWGKFHLSSVVNDFPSIDLSF